MGFRLVPTSMILDDIERRNNLYFAFFTELDSFAGQLVTVVEDRPIMSVKLSPSFSLPLLTKTNAPCSAVSLR